MIYSVFEVYDFLVSFVPMNNMCIYFYKYSFHLYVALSSGQSDLNNESYLLFRNF